MGIAATYMSLPNDLADTIAELDNENIVPKLEQLIEQQACPMYHMDKLWDGLHFWLTGASASTPIEGDPLSEAVVGVHVLDTEDFVGVIGSDELQPIIDALRQVDRQALQQQRSMASFRANEIYPNTWEDSFAAERFAELETELDQLIAFYETSLRSNQDVIITIY